MASTDVRTERGRATALSPFNDPFMRDAFAPIGGGLGRLLADAFDGPTFPGLASDGQSLGQGFAAPNLDISETEDAIEVAADLPGIDPSEIEVTVEKGVLTISGNREREHKEDDEERNYHRVERFRGRFMRRVALPSGVDESAVTARHDKGVLTIRVPKTGENGTNGHRVEIEAA